MALIACKVTFYHLQTYLNFSPLNLVSQITSHMGCHNRFLRPGGGLSFLAASLVLQLHFNINHKGVKAIEVSQMIWEP